MYIAYTLSKIKNTATIHQRALNKIVANLDHGLVSAVQDQDHSGT